MTGWQTLRLGDVGEAVTGATPRSSNPEHFGDHGLAFLTPTDISWMSRRPEYKRFISDSGAAALRRRILPANTPCFVAIGTIGKIALPDRAVIPNQQIHGVIAKPHLASPTFIYYLLREASPRISALATGSTMPIINKTDFLSLKFQFPPLAEQERIAGVLGAFDDLIETNRALIASIADLTAAVYARASARATDFVPLGELVTANPSQTRPGDKDMPIKYLDIGAMADGVMGQPQSLTWAEAPSRARRLAQVGDVLWATVRPNRRAHALLVRDIPNLVVSTGVVVLRPDEIPMSLAFAHTDTQSFVDRLVALCQGSAYPAAKPADFLSIMVPRLSSDDLDIFSTAIDPLWLVAGELETETDELTRQRDELLPLLMSGKVRVSELEGVA